MELQRILEEVEAARKNQSSSAEDFYLGKMHTLAEAQYPPAIDFFVNCLDDSRWDWREICLTAVGFHYKFSPDHPVIAKIRELLLTDPNDFVRVAAASVLGTQSKWLDSDLLHTLQFDASDAVRRAAFASLLELAGVSPLIRNSEEKRAKSGKISPTVKEMERILAEANIDLQIPH